MCECTLVYVSVSRKYEYVCLCVCVSVFVYLLILSEGLSTPFSLLQNLLHTINPKLEYFHLPTFRLLPRSLVRLKLG